MSVSNYTRPKAIAFDIIGTVFQQTPLRSKVIALGLPGAALEGWSAAADRDAAALAATGDYRPFAEVQRAALDSVLAEQSLEPSTADRQALLDAASTDMSPRDGADEALARAAKAGVTVIALTNGSGDPTRRLLEKAGFASSITHVISTDEVRLAKPRAEVYLRACEVAKVQPEELALVAAHAWDIQGAAAAGLTTAYLNIDRPYSSAMRPPDLEAETLTKCVEKLLAL